MFVTGYYESATLQKQGKKTDALLIFVVCQSKSKKECIQNYILIWWGMIYIIWVSQNQVFEFPQMFFDGLRSVQLSFFSEAG